MVCILIETLLCEVALDWRCLDQSNVTVTAACWRHDRRAVNDSMRDSIPLCAHHNPLSNGV